LIHEVVTPSPRYGPRLHFAAPLIIHWKCLYDRCPSCGADLAAHAEARAVAEARADRARDEARVCYWAEGLTTCPRCGCDASSPSRDYWFSAASQLCY
jgi:hypothetical protein